MNQSQEITTFNPCYIQLGIRVLGGKWKMVILYHLVSGPKRFKELERIIATISPRMLVKELKDLERENLIYRKVFPSVPPAVEYGYTEYGKTIIPIIQAIENWGEKHQHV